MTKEGLKNVCYAAGFDVSTADGAANCSGFVNAAITMHDCKGVTGCDYGYPPHASMDSDRNARKCIFDSTMNFVLAWEKGLNTSSELPGNENGNVTKYGITSQYSGLSVNCVKCMTWQQAQNWYWSKMYNKFHFDKMPIYISAPLMQFSVQHNGYVLKETKQIILEDAKVKEAGGLASCSASELTPKNYANTFFMKCSQDAAAEYVKIYGGQHLFDAIVNNEINYWSKKPKYKKRAESVRTELWPATQQCLRQNRLM